MGMGKAIGPVAMRSMTAWAVVPDPFDEGHPLLHLRALALGIVDAGLVGNITPQGPDGVMGFHVHGVGHHDDRASRHAMRIDRLMRLARLDAGISFHVIEEDEGAIPVVTASRAHRAEEHEAEAARATMAKTAWLDANQAGWRSDRHANGCPKWSPDGTMLDDRGNRSIFDDVDE